MKTASVVLLMLALVGCGPSQKLGLPVQIIIPDGYRGVVSLKLDKGGGIAIPAANGQLTVTIPADGKLAVKSLDFVLGRHVLTAQYAKGDPLADASLPGNIAFRLVGVSPDSKTVTYVVGTDKDQTDAQSGTPPAAP